MKGNNNNAALVEKTIMMNVSINSPKKIIINKVKMMHMASTFQP